MLKPRKPGNSEKHTVSTQKNTIDTKRRVDNSIDQKSNSRNKDEQAGSISQAGLNDEGGCTYCCYDDGIVDRIEANPSQCLRHDQI